MTRRKKTVTEEQPAAAPGLRLEWRSPAELVENPRNWRRHPESQLKALAGAVSEVGWAGACLYNEATGRLIDGHARRKVAQEQGCELVPVLVGNWTEAQEAKILATLDPMAGMAVADPVMLDQLIRGVDTACPELADLISQTWEDAQADAIDEVTPPADPTDAEPQTDRAAELREKWGTEQGQLWLLGLHRLLCGDCREAASWERLLNDERVNVCMTSPPYASQRKYDESSGFKPIKPDDYVSWWEPLQACVRSHLAEDGSFFVNIKPHCEDGERVLYVFDLVLAMKRRFGWRFVDEFCWRLTTNGMPGNFAPRLKNAFEPVYWFSRGTPALRSESIMQEAKPASIKRYTNLSEKERSGKRQYSATGSGFNKDFTAFSLNESMPSNVIELAPAVNDSFHSAAFPVGLPSFFYRAFSDENDIVADPFMGSGTSIMAAQNLNRQARGIEISPAYCAVILQRFQDAFPDQEIRQA